MTINEKLNKVLGRFVGKHFNDNTLTQVEAAVGQALEECWDPKGNCLARHLTPSAYIHPLSPGRIRVRFMPLDAVGIRALEENE